VVDDLNTPLGQDATEKRRVGLPLAVPQAAAGILGLFVAIFVLWAATADDPFGGEPMVVVAVEPGASSPPKPAEEVAAVPAAQGKIEAPSRYDGPPPAPSQPAANTKTVTIIDGSTGNKREEVIPANPVPTAPVSPRAVNANASTNSTADQRLLEISRHGPIPKIGPDGLRPADAYARPVKLVQGKPDGPRIAIVVSGLGIGANGTSEALAKLPAPVTFAFAPYSADVDRLATRARGEGHEVLLQVPMEPFDYPDNDPGPQTLLTTLGADQNVDRLQWLMSRFQGYVGLTNYMGARFTASEPSLSPVLKEAAKRGLIYLDDGTSPRSLAGQIAGANNLPFAKAGVLLDAVPTPVEIDRALARMEMIAKERGIAVGVTAALPVAIDRIAKWSKAAESRGFTLVPITAVAIKAKSS
jgi:polysaccharide deacetylase 2 family uncharacterized protein YibQ